MAPPGFLISRLGIQSTASDERVHGLICLRGSLPAHIDGPQSSRWPLFTSNPPHLLCPPSILPIPLTSPFRSSSRHSSASRTASSKTLLIASTLLSLPQPSPYPPSAPGPRPYLDVSSTTGQVSVVLDPATATGSRRGRKSLSGNGSGSPTHEGKREWLIIMEFEAPVERASRGTRQVFLALPKCVHSVIRLHVSPPHASSSTPSGEASIITEPKMLALPASTFDAPAASFPYLGDQSAATRQGGRLGFEDDWEDGEDLREEEYSEDGNTDEGEDDDGGSWLEGRFQGTDILRLEWSFSPESSSMPRLEVMPQWHPSNPAIALSYEMTLSPGTESGLITVEHPPGWGWAELLIQADEMVSWQATDCENLEWSRFQDHTPTDTEDEGDTTAQDDSFSTVRHRSADHQRTRLSPLPTSSTTNAHRPSTPAQSSASLMRQPHPMNMEQLEDFSFEMYSEDHEYPPTNSLAPSPPARLLRTESEPRSTTPLQPQVANRIREVKPLIPLEPIEARHFDLQFGRTDHEGASQDLTLILQGVLVPLSPLLLVSSATPCEIPFIRFEQADGPSEQTCHLTCSGEILPNDSVKDNSTPIRSVAGASIGTFRWTDREGQMIKLPKTDPIEGNVRVRLHRSTWGNITMKVNFIWPARSTELAFQLDTGAQDEKKSRGSSTRIQNATADGQDIRRCLFMSTKGGELGEVRLRGGRSGQATEVTLEMGWRDVDAGRIPLPLFVGGEGKMIVDLRGEGWEGRLSSLDTNLVQSPTSPTTFTLDHSPASSVKQISPYISIRTASSSLPSVTSIQSNPSRRRYRRTLFSVSTLINLVLFWVIISLGHQVKKLRNEVAFVAEEARDLRYYGLGQNQLHSFPDHSKTSHVPTESGVHTGVMESDAGLARRVEIASQTSDQATALTTSLDFETDAEAPSHRINHDTSTDQILPQVTTEIHTLFSSSVPASTQISTSLGRVVFGSSGWDQWALHPAVQTIGRGVTWIWSAVIWLLVPS